MTPNTPDSMQENSGKKRIGIFTGGGTAPGLNSVVGYTTLELREMGHDVIGIPDGWAGLLETRKDIIELSSMSRKELYELLRRPSTILGTSRTKIKEENYEKVWQTAEAYKLTGVVAIGGDDTLGQARKFSEAGIVNMVGVPKTIDNDVMGTDRTFGFETAYHLAAERIRKLRFDAEGTRRVAIAEVMGRDAGWITLYAGKAGLADITLIPEFPIDEQELMAQITSIYDRNKHVVIALAEGYSHQGATIEENGNMDAFGHAKKKGAASVLSKAIQKQTGRETMTEILGYDIRCGEPVASDAIFAAELGAYAGHLAGTGQWGTMVALRNGRITHVPLSHVSGGRLVTEEYYDKKRMTMRNIPWSINSGMIDIQKQVHQVVPS